MVTMLAQSCSKDSSDFKSDAANIKVSIVTVGGNSFPKTINTQINSITLTSVRVVIDGIEFESIDEDSMDFELEDPFIQSLNVSGTLHEIDNVTVPFGEYKEMEIEIDRLKSEDGQVYIDNPELQNQSIRVEGYLDGDTSNTFLFLSQMEVEQESEFDTPLVLDESSPSTNVVLEVDLSTWFLDGNNQLVDPNDPDNKSLIENNIQKSFHVFEDDDDDGHPDED